MTNYEKVKEFHEKFGLPILTQPQLPYTDRLKLRCELIAEEFQELRRAVYVDMSVIDAADALSDLAYVVYGMALECGIDLDACFAEVHASNMSKLGTDGKPIYRADGKVLKGPNFRKPDLGAVLWPKP